jgi:hypothetical protein
MKQTVQDIGSGRRKQLATIDATAVATHPGSIISPAGNSSKSERLVGFLEISESKDQIKA